MYYWVLSKNVEVYNISKEPILVIIIFREDYLTKGVYHSSIITAHPDIQRIFVSATDFNSRNQLEAAMNRISAKIDEMLALRP